MSEGQRELLDRLRINRDEEEDEGGGNRWLIVGVAMACALVAAGAIYLFWPKGTDSAAVAETLPAATAPDSKALPAGSGGVLSASGYVTARRLATVSAEITGRMSEVLIEEGMTVKYDQVLARLDATLAKTEVDISEGNVKSARGGLAAASSDRAEAQRQLARIRGVNAKAFASTADLTRAEAAAEGAEARYAQAQGALNSAQASLERAKVLLDKHEIRAPFGGVVTTKDAQPGEIVSPAAAGGGFTRTGVCTIVDMNSLEVEVEVNESFISRVKAGQRASATLDAYPDWEIPAKVTAIIPTANRDKATVKVRVGIEARDPRILPEMAAKVLFFNDDKPEAAAPASPAPAASPQGTAP
ncbi:MAG: efflux RND transporter periplasmic adaptor subunit [Alphaproteobacteria bacterium]|nr:efflux RND transporter periplasmic adaptor subunit [Alphaproteobacteria bacterium]